MDNPETMTPHKAGTESAQNLKLIRLADQALQYAHTVIERSEANAQDSSLDNHRRAIGEWHAKYWSENTLPELTNELEKLENKASRDYKKHQGAYNDAALAEALLDGVEISR